MSPCVPAGTAPRFLRRLGLPVIIIIALATSALAVAPLSARAEATCATAVGRRVTLQSDAADPDVFVWDARPRLAAYAARGWDSAREVLAHTLLANPGTIAKVVACAAGAAHPRYGSAAADALGVKIVAGPFRGHFGWVISTDARELTR